MDQFEEIFTLGERPARRSTSTAFRETLAALVENRPPPSLRAMLEEDDDLAERLDYKARHTRVLLSLREDFLHLLERWRRSMPSLMENRLELRMLSGPQAFLAVVRPGQLRSGMPAIIPDQVGQAIVRFVAGANDDVPLDEIDAVPPLLSLVCAELNAQRLDSGEPQISQAQFEGHGTDILKSFYVRSFDLATYGSALDGVPDADAALENLRSLIEDRLLSPDGFRESIAFDTIARDLSHAAQRAASHAVLDALVERRLLTVEERGGVRRIELAHDVLTRIVKASRDERHEVEAISRARSEQERAEAETARILKERNRLKRLAILASCLALIAAGGAIVGWLGLKRSEEAKAQALQAKNQAVNARNQAVESEKKAVDARNQALVARNEAQLGFESAWKGLTTLYDDYASGTLENTPGISGRQANALKSKLRGHLLEQLRKLNHEHTDHRGTIHYISRLLLDEGREAIADADLTRARARLTEALQWSGKRPLDSASEAELYAEILLEQARLPSHAGDSKRGAEAAASSLPAVRRLASRWPDSWRIEYVVIRLEYVKLRPDIDNRHAFASLAERLVPLIEKSGRHFDPVVSHFTIETTGFRTSGGFDRGVADYSSLRNLIVWFREHLVQGNSYTLVQLENVAGRFHNLLEFTGSQFAKPNDKSTAAERRAVLNELETTMKAIETRLPKSTIVYGTRGVLLRLQDMSVKDGINTRSRDELRAASEKHRMVPSALGVGSSVADLLATAFTSYVDRNAVPAAKTAAHRAVQNAMQDFVSLDLFGADTVLQNPNIVLAGELLSELGHDDPVAAIYKQMVDHYLQLYIQANRDSRSAFIGTVASITRAQVESWHRNRQYQKVAGYWDRFYAGLPIMTFTSGETVKLIDQLTLCASSLLRIGRGAEGHRLLNDTFMLCESILADRPWAYFVREPMFQMCFDAAKILSEGGEPRKAQEWLRRGWALYKECEGNDIDLGHYAELPLQGTVPKNIPDNDASFFAQKGSPKRFTIRVDFNGVKSRYYIYVRSGKNAYQRLLDQFRWVSEIREGTVPKELQQIFERIHKLAEDNKINYQELCAKEFPKAVLLAAETQLQAARAIVNAQDKQKATPDEIADKKRTLSAAYAAVSRAAMDFSSWKKLGDYATGWLEELDEENPSALSSLAIALFAQERITLGLEIYIRYWDAPDNNHEFRKVAGADIESLTDSEGKIGSLRMAYLLARASNTSFPEVMKFVFRQEIVVQLLDNAITRLKEAEGAYLKDKSDANRQKLAAICNAASHLALFRKRWTDAENWARKAVELKDSSGHTANANLATAWLFQGKYEQALEIYRKYWKDPWKGNTLGDEVLADFEALENYDIKHPDVSRIKAALGKTANTSPSSTHKPKAETKP